MAEYDDMEKIRRQPIRHIGPGVIVSSEDVARLSNIMGGHDNIKRLRIGARARSRWGALATWPVPLRREQYPRGRFRVTR